MNPRSRAVTVYIVEFVRRGALLLYKTVVIRQKLHQILAEMRAKEDLRHDNMCIIHEQLFLCTNVTN